MAKKAETASIGGVSLEPSQSGGGKLISKKAKFVPYGQS